MRFFKQALKTENINLKKKIKPAKHQVCVGSFEAIDRLACERRRPDDGTARLGLPLLYPAAPFLLKKSTPFKLTKLQLHILLLLLLLYSNYYTLVNESNEDVMLSPHLCSFNF